MTGASGHVGGALAARLVEEGHEVIAVSRRLALVPGLSQTLAVDLAAPGARQRLAEAGRCEAIVHAAAAVVHAPDDLSVSLVNCAGTQLLVTLAEEWHTERLVYISGVPVIGRPRTLPVTEEHPVDPPTAYHASKLYGEQLVELARRRGLSAATLRLTSPVGPGTPDGRILSVFVRRAISGDALEVAGSGRRTQDYVDVRDAADAVAACLDRDVSGLFNVASGRSVSNLELAERCVAALGSSSPIRVGERPDPEDAIRWEVSIERAAERFGYAPSRSLADSIAAVAASRPRGMAKAIGSSPGRGESSK